MGYLRSCRATWVRPGAIACVALILAGSIPAIALNDLQRMELAQQLGSVLAGESACGLSYDQDAISDFIEAKVPADDMQFSGLLTLMTSGVEYEVSEMSVSQMTAFCTQTRRVARSYGFTK